MNPDKEQFNNPPAPPSTPDSSPNDQKNDILPIQKDPSWQSESHIKNSANEEFVYEDESENNVFASRVIDQTLQEEELKKSEKVSAIRGRFSELRSYFIRDQILGEDKQKGIFGKRSKNLTPIANKIQITPPYSSSAQFVKNRGSLLVEGSSITGDVRSKSSIDEKNQKISTEKSDLKSRSRFEKGRFLWEGRGSQKKDPLLAKIEDKGALRKNIAQQKSYESWGRSDSPFLETLINEKPLAPDIRSLSSLPRKPKSCSTSSFPLKAGNRLKTKS